MRISDWSSDVCSSDLGIDQREKVIGLLRADHLHLEAEAARHGGEALHLQQAVGRAGEAQAAYLFPVDGLPGLRLQPLVELARALQHAEGFTRGRSEGGSEGKEWASAGR